MFLINFDDFNKYLGLINFIVLIVIIILITTRCKSNQGFKNHNNKKKIIFVVAPWCGHCKRMENVRKEVEQAAKKTGEFEVITLEDGKNDGEIEKLSSYVRGFPTILGVDNKGEISVYQNSRTKDLLIDFAKKL